MALEITARPALQERARLAKEIRREHDKALTSARSAIEHAVRCGQLLAQAKRVVPHGEWGAWLDENFPASHRTAQGWMRLARADTQSIAHLGVGEALREIASPTASEKDTTTPPTVPGKLYRLSSNTRAIRNSDYSESPRKRAIAEKAKQRMWGALSVASSTMLDVFDFDHIQMVAAVSTADDLAAMAKQASENARVYRELSRRITTVNASRNADDHDR